MLYLTGNNNIKPDTYHILAATHVSMFPLYISDFGTQEAKLCLLIVYKSILNKLVCNNVFGCYTSFQ